MVWRMNRRLRNFSQVRVPQGQHTPWAFGSGWPFALHEVDASLSTGKGHRTLALLTAAVSIATGGMMLYVVTATREANISLVKTEAALATVNLASSEYDLAARVVHQLGAQNAAEFAAILDKPSSMLKFFDDVLEKQLRNGAGFWAKKERLMTGEARSGLYLRQIAFIKLKNLSRRTPATKLKLVYMTRDFRASPGEFVDAPYGTPSNLAGAGWVKGEIELPTLMEVSAETQGMQNEVLIPLAEVSGAHYHIGRVFVPLTLHWTDERLGKERDIVFDFFTEVALANQLRSAILGKSEDKR